MKKSSIIQILDVQKIKVEIDNYQFALFCIVAFDKIFKESIGAETTQGKTLQTSAKNEISPSTSVTPDLVVEVPKNAKIDYKVINEIKASFPKEKEQWYAYARQLKKYDDELSGWKYNTSKRHDIMITTDIAYTSNFHQYLQGLQGKYKIKFDRSFSIIECIRRERAEQQLFIRKFSGDISNSKLDEMLTSGKTIVLYNILNDINKTKFYDAHPPEIYTMMILWDSVFPKYVNSRPKFRDLQQNRIVELEITVEQMHKILSKFTPDSNPGCIKKSWIEMALLWFQELGIVDSPTTGDKFVIRYRKHKEKTLDWLLEKTKKHSSSQEKQTKNTVLDGYIPTNDEDNFTVEKE